MARNYNIAVCLPFHRDVTMRWALDFRRMQMPGPHFFIITSHYQLDQSREELARDAVESGATHALFVDSDIKMPSNSMFYAMYHNYPIVSGYYWAKRGHPAAWAKTERGYEPIVTDRPTWFFADYVGFGFILVDCRVFKRMTRPWFVYERMDDIVSIKFDSVGKMLEQLRMVRQRRKSHEVRHGEDSYFFRKLREEIGIKVLVDTRIELAHEEMMEFWPDGKVEFQRVVREPLSEDRELGKVVGR